MGKSRKDYEKFLNSISPDGDDEAWIIGGKNRYCGRENYGTMIKRYDPIGFNVGYREWAEQPGSHISQIVNDENNTNQHNSHLKR